MRHRRRNSSGSSDRSTPRHSGTCWLACPPRVTTSEPGCPPDRRPGYDLTFSAPKGVSLLWALRLGRTSGRDLRGPRPGRRRCSRPSVDRGLLRPARCRGAELRRSQRLRRRRLPSSHQPGRRSPAPHPRRRPQPGPGRRRRWSAPDGRHLYTWKKTAGTLYQSALRAELAPFGLRLAGPAQRPGGAVRHPEDDPAGLLQAQGGYRGGHGRSGASTSAKAAEIAALATRARKPSVTAPCDLLREGWTEQLPSIDLPDGEGGSRPATVDDLPSLWREQRSSCPDPRRPRPSSRSSGRERRACRSTTGRSTSTVASHTTSRSGPCPSPCSVRPSPDGTRISAVARAFDVTPDQALALTSDLPRSGQIVVTGPERKPMTVAAEWTSVRTKSGQLDPGSPAVTGATPPPSSWPPRSGSSARQWIGSGRGRHRSPR